MPSLKYYFSVSNFVWAFKENNFQLFQLKVGAFFGLISRCACFLAEFNISTEFYFQSGGSLETASLPDGSERRFDDLMSHQREIVRDSGRMEAFGSFFTVLQDCLGESLPPKPEVLEIYGRILINSFNIMDDEYQPLGN
jgi:hypothetical protein